jgi:methanol dehydrogenase (cytochrome c) subunit 1
MLIHGTAGVWKFKLPSGVIGHPIASTYAGNMWRFTTAWRLARCGLVFDLRSPQVWLTAFKELAHTHGGGVMVFALGY